GCRARLGSDRRRPAGDGRRIPARRPRWRAGPAPRLRPRRGRPGVGLRRAPPLTPGGLLAWSVVALLVVAPALTLLFLLDQRTELGEDPTTSRPAGDDGATRYPGPTPTGP